MKSQYKYVTVFAVIILAILSAATVINIIVSGRSVLLNGTFLTVINALAAFAVIVIAYMAAVVFNICNGKSPKGSSLRISLVAFSTLFSFITSTARLLRVDRDEIRRMLVCLNNAYVVSKKYELMGEDIMLLAPHCIQKSFCSLKVTYDVSNCKKCGKCSIADFLRLREKYGIKVFVATGGTLARKIICENRPKAIVAIACERDLTSGIQDVTGIPVLGVYNERPNGPCFNTEVNIEDVEKAIKFFMGEY